MMHLSLLRRSAALRQARGAFDGGGMRMRPLASAAAAGGGRIVAPPMVFIKGEEMTRYCMQLIMDEWVSPRVDTSAWEFYDLSCVARDDSEDQVLHDAVAAGSRIGAIFKEPTITPTEVQKVKLGLKQAWGSPNGAMRRGWNGITISRDTIHIDGLELGFKRPVLFERHAVGGEFQAFGGQDVIGAPPCISPLQRLSTVKIHGCVNMTAPPGGWPGEYAAGWKPVGAGRITTLFQPDEGAR
jgi:hypothetical protein